MKKLTNIVLIFFLLTSCSVVKHFAGANIDTEQFEKARQAKVAQVRLKHAQILSDKLKNIEKTKSDIYVELKKDVVTKIVSQYNGMTGWIDNVTTYQIVNSTVVLNNGSGIATLEMKVNNSAHNVDVDLIMDCLIAFKTTSKDIELEIEPFNISPNVKMGGLLSGASGIVENLIKINLAQMNKNFPPMKVPVDLKNTYKIEGTKTEVKDQLKMTINNPERKINYNLKVLDILVFQNKIQIPINVDKVEVN